MTLHEQLQRARREILYNKADAVFWRNDLVDSIRYRLSLKVPTIIGIDFNNPYTPMSIEYWQPKSQSLR